jgi:DnaJ-class molecular chaperone
MDPGGEWGGASLFESLFDRVEKGMFGSFSGVSPGTALHAELVLSRYEAAVGGTYRIEVPITERCGYCFRFGGLSSGFCPVCGGSGRIRTTRPIDLDVPAGVADGTRNTVRLDSEDTDGILLTIDVAVEGRPIR